MLEIRISIMGDLVLSRALSRFGEGVSDFTPVWQQIREDFAVIEEEQFASEGARGGSPWPPLSPTYAAWKAKNFGGLPLLQRTMRMWSELAVGTGLNVTMNPKTLFMAPTVPYAVFHQKGTRTMPQRKVIMLTEADKINWMKFVHNYVYDKAREQRLL